jgi:hypothetical protein
MIEVQFKARTYNILLLGSDSFLGVIIPLEIIHDTVQSMFHRNQAHPKCIYFHTTKTQVYLDFIRGVGGAIKKSSSNELSNPPLLRAGNRTPRELTIHSKYKLFCITDSEGKILNDEEFENTSHKDYRLCIVMSDTILSVHNSLLRLV